MGLLTPLAVAVSFATVVRGEVTLQPDSILNYVPNLAGNIVFGIIYTALALVLFYHVFFTGPKHDKWALVLPIAASFEALGFWLRIPLRTYQSNQPIYIVMYLFVVLSPAGFLAFNYILFGRFAAALQGTKPSLVKKQQEEKTLQTRSKITFLPPRLIKIIFVTSDVVTFCIQAAGGGLQTSQMFETIKVGNHIFLAGTIIQTFSYIVFAALTIVAHARLYYSGNNNVSNKHQYSVFNIAGNPVVQLVDLLYLSSIGLLIRSCYRIAEFAQGYGGDLYSHEIYTFLLDGLPLVIAIGVWAIFWPGLMMRKIRADAPALIKQEQQQISEGSDFSHA
jgi:hypothetical protein